MNLKPEIIEQIRSSNHLQSVIASVSDKGLHTVIAWIKNNNEQLTLARYLFPLAAHLKTSIEELIDLEN